MRPLAIAGTLIALFTASEALAQCSKDTDCKGDRVCENGHCVQPGPAASAYSQPLPPPPPPAAAPAPAAAQPAPAAAPVQVIVNNNGPAAPAQALRLEEPRLGRTLPSAGGALAGGIVGLVLAGPIFALSASASSSGSIGLHTASLLLSVILTPIIAGAGSGARSGTDVHGIVVLRVFGWILYVAGTVVGAFEMLTWYLNPSQLSGSTMLAAGSCHAASLLFFVIDDFVSFGQVKGYASRMKTGQASLEVGQYVSPILLADGKVGLGYGLAGRF